MAVGTWTASATASTAIAEDMSRGNLEIQHTSGEEVYLAFGDDTPVVGSGIRISNGQPYYRVQGTHAYKAIKMICDTAETAGGGYAQA